MPKIRLVTSGTYPDGMASTYRIQCYAKALQIEGSEIEVVSPISLRKYAGRKVLLKGKHQGVPYTVILNLGKPSNKWIDYFYAEIKCYILLMHTLITAKKFDILWLYGMGFIPRMVLLPLLHLLGKKVVLELNEYPYATEGNAYTRIPIVHNLLQKGTMSYVFPQFDGIVAISESLKVVAEQYGKKCRPILKIPILLDTEMHLIEKEGEKPLEELYLFHAGTLSEQKDGILSYIKGYVEAASKLIHNGKILKLVLTNQSSYVWSVIEQLLKDANLFENLIITGYLNRQELINWMSHSSVLVINKPDSFQNQYNFPTKLGDYLLSGRPVICGSKHMELNKYLIHKKNCIQVEPNSPEAIAESIIELILTPELANEIGANGRKSALANFDYQVHSERLKEFFSMV